MPDLGLSLGDCICVYPGKAQEVIRSGSQGCVAALTYALSLSFMWYRQFFVLIYSVLISRREKLASDSSWFFEGRQESTEKLCKMKGILPLLMFYMKSPQCCYPIIFSTYAFVLCTNPTELYWPWHCPDYFSKFGVCLGLFQLSKLTSR